jgi:hypothetical protein
VAYDGEERFAGLISSAPNLPGVALTHNAIHAYSESTSFATGAAT